MHGSAVGGHGVRRRRRALGAGRLLRRKALAWRYSAAWFRQGLILQLRLLLRWMRLWRWLLDSWQRPRQLCEGRWRLQLSGRHELREEAAGGTAIHCRTMRADADLRRLSLRRLQGAEEEKRCPGLGRPGQAFRLLHSAVL